jgi:hypothetical protein
MKPEALLFNRKTLPFLLMFFLFFSAAHGQAVETNKARNLWWVVGGGGFSTQGGSLGFGLSHQFRPHIFTGRFVRNYDSDGGGTQAWDVGVLYGRSYKTQQAMISASAGVGYVGPSPEFGTIGIPLESQIFWTPTRYFGIGVYGFGNLNTKESFGGALLSLQFGRLTSHYKY